MYLYMCSFLETKSVALSRGRPPQNKRKGMPLESAPLDIKLHSLALPIWLWIGIRVGRQNSTLPRRPHAPTAQNTCCSSPGSGFRNRSPSTKCRRTSTTKPTSSSRTSLRRPRTNCRSNQRRGRTPSSR